MFNSLRMRLMAVYAVLFILGLGGLAAWAGQQISASTLDDTGTSLQASSFLLAAQMHESLEYSPQGAVAQAEQSALELNANVYIFVANRQIWYQTDLTSTTLWTENNYTVRTEPDGTERFVATSPILDDGSPIGWVQITQSTEFASRLVWQRLAQLGIGFAAVAILGLAVSGWLLSNLTQPITDLRETALAMADGDLSQRTTVQSSDEIGLLGQAFNTMATRVESVVKEQRAFASNASHELRTPLTTIRLRTEALINEELDEDESRQYITEIDSEVQRMGGLVEDLLMLSRLDAQRLSAGEEHINAVRLLQQLEREFAPTATEKNVTLTFDLPADPIMLIANTNHVHVTFRNIIENAVRYTPAEGQVAVTLQQTPTHATLKVSDNGAGIAAEDLPKIGQRFFRGDKAHTRKNQGTGLGIALVQSILELYKGDFEIDSEGLGQGSTATVKWPLGVPS